MIKITFEKGKAILDVDSSINCDSIIPIINNLYNSTNNERVFSPRNVDGFGLFVEGHIRIVPGWDAPPNFAEIWKAYRTWAADKDPTGKKITQTELRIRLNKIYQMSPDGKTYKHIRLFFSEEEVEEFDKEIAGET